MTSTIENEILEQLIAVYEEQLNRLRPRRLGSAKKIIIGNMEDILARAKACLPAPEDCYDYAADDLAFDAAREDRIFGRR